MDEKTILFDGSNPEVEHEEQKRIVTDNDFKNEVADKSQKRKKHLNVLRNAALASGGLIAGAAAMAFNLHQETDSDPTPNPAENVKPQVPFVVHDESPIAQNVTDNMSFNDAFAVARQEVGPGGIFSWHGNIYNTYYKEEWDSMSADDKQHFAQSINNDKIDSNNVQPSQVIIKPDLVVVPETTDKFIGSEEVTLEDGETIHVGYFQHGNEIIMKFDIDGDNSYDYIFDEKSNQLIGLNGNSDIDLSQLNVEGTVSEVEPIMSEYVDIEGYNALVTTFSDGSQQAQIDLDGDGTYDTTLNLDASGNMEVYDINNNLITQDDLLYGDPIVENSIENADTDYSTHYDGGYEQIADNNTDFGQDFDNHVDTSDWA